MKKILLIIFKLLDKRTLVEVLLELLENQAKKTSNKVDDEVVNFLKSNKETLIESLEDVDKKES